MTTSVNVMAHNGIPVYSGEDSGDSIGTLIFGVGLRDEPATQAGITHLVEHVLLRMVQPVTVRHGGTANVDFLEFYASGEPAEVAGYLNAVAAAIRNFANVSEEDLRLEKSIIEAENPRSFSAVTSGLLTYRFGTEGYGAAQFGAATTAALTRAEVVSWTERWLTVGNAAITFTGAPPLELDVRLPSGGPVTRAQTPAVITTPTLVMAQKTGVALSLVVPLKYERFLGHALRYELLARLRHAKGLVYSVELITTEFDDGNCQLDLVLDPVGENLVEALKSSVTAIRDIASNGFSQEAILSGLNELHGEDEDGANSPEEVALNNLLGRNFPAKFPARRRTVDRESRPYADELTQTLASALDSLIVAVDSSAKVRRKDVAALGLALDRFTIWQQHRTSGNRAELRKPPSGNRPNVSETWRHKSTEAVMWLTETHLMKQQSNKLKSMRLADVVVVGDRDCGCICLLDRRGRSIDLDMDDWKNAKTLRRSLLRAFPGDVVRPFPED